MYTGSKHTHHLCVMLQVVNAPNTFVSGYRWETQTSHLLLCYRQLTHPSHACNVTGSKHTRHIRGMLQVVNTPVTCMACYRLTGINTPVTCVICYRWQTYPSHTYHVTGSKHIFQIFSNIMRLLFSMIYKYMKGYHTMKEVLSNIFFRSMLLF